MNLNEYFKKLKLNKCIVVIVSRDEASKFISEFSLKTKLKLKMDLKYRDSYVAVIDYKRDFVYEEKSQQKIECSYKLNNQYINIVSMGLNAGFKSSIKIDNEEFCYNKTGLNIAIFNNKNLQLIDKFYVNSFTDKSLTIKRVGLDG